MSDCNASPDIGEDLTEDELTTLARHAGMHGEDHLRHPPAGRHPLCDWCQYPHIRACRIIADLRSARAEVARWRALDVQQIAAGVLREYGLGHEDLFHAATRIAELVEGT